MGGLSSYSILRGEELRDYGFKHSCVVGICELFQAVLRFGMQTAFLCYRKSILWNTEILFNRLDFW